MSGKGNTFPEGILSSFPLEKCSCDGAAKCQPTICSERQSHFKALVNEQCSSGCISTLRTARYAALVTHMYTHLDQLVVRLCDDDLQTPLSQQHQVAVRVLRHLGTVHVLEP